MWCPVLSCKDPDQVKTRIFMFGGETGLSPLGRLRLGLTSDWWRDKKNRLLYIFERLKKHFYIFSDGTFDGCVIGTVIGAISTALLVNIAMLKLHLIPEECHFPVAYLIRMDTALPDNEAPAESHKQWGNDILQESCLSIFLRVWWTLHDHFHMSLFLHFHTSFLTPSDSRYIY